MHKPLARFHFVTAVWGAGHRGTFLDIGLPSLLSDGNLPGMSVLGDCRYQVFTKASDLPEIESSAAFRYLREIIQVEIDLIDDQPGAAPHTIMSDCHRHGLRRAHELGAGTVFVPPDCVWADGTMVNLERIARDVASTIHMSGLRLVLEDALPELVSGWRAPDGRVLQIPPRSLVALGMRHLHPITKDLFFREKSEKLMPANLLWTVGDEGILARCFHLHPLLIEPSALNATFKTTIDDDLALVADPEGIRDYVSQDSDEILAFELSASTHKVQANYAKGVVADVAAWAEVAANPRHRMLVQKSIRIRSFDMTQECWAPVEKEADSVVQEALALLRKSTFYLLRKGLQSNAWHRSLAAKLRSPEALEGSFFQSIMHSPGNLAFSARGLPQRLIYTASRAFQRLIYNSFQVLQVLLYNLFRVWHRVRGLAFRGTRRIRPWSWRWNFEREVSRPLLAAIPDGTRYLIVLGAGIYVEIPMRGEPTVISIERLAHGGGEVAPGPPFDLIVYFAAPGEVGSGAISLLSERLGVHGLLHICLLPPESQNVGSFANGGAPGLTWRGQAERGSLGTALLTRVFASSRRNDSGNTMGKPRSWARSAGWLVFGPFVKLAVFPLASLLAFALNAAGTRKGFPAAAVITLERTRA